MTDWARGDIVHSASAGWRRVGAEFVQLHGMPVLATGGELDTGQRPLGEAARDGDAPVGEGRDALHL